VGGAGKTNDRDEEYIKRFGGKT